jgi:deoxyguanosine kinase
MIKAEHNCKLILEQFADNPFLPLFYKEPERYAFTVELFFMTERYKQLQAEMSHRDLFFDFTIADYSFIKTLLFAKINLKDEEFKLFTKMYNVLSQLFPVPDLYVYFHRSVDALQSNIGKRGRSYESQIKNDYLGKVQDAYFEYLRNVVQFPVLLIDVNEIDFVHNKGQYEMLKSFLKKQYLPGVHRISLIS